MSVTTGDTQLPAAIGATDQDLAADHEVGEYRIEKVLGKGGFGTVYGAIQPVIGKRVAIKILARKFSADPEMVSRFVAEARAVNQIRHRNIIDIFSFGQLPDGRHYYVMEFLDGEPLDQYIRTHGPMSLDEALPILRAIARALDAAHAKGIAHRDLKPENILLAQDADGARFPKLLDFGIAKLLNTEDDVRHRTGTGVPLGTPYYMSPEQCRGREVDHRTDIYSFGIVVYRLLTGTLPFEGENFMDLLFKQVNDEPPPPSARNPALTSTVDNAVAWMMRKDRAQRPPTVLEGVNALDPSQAITAPPMRGSRPSVAPRVGAADALAATITPQFERPMPSQRRAWPIALALALVLAAGGVAAVLVLQGGDAPEKPVATPSSPAPAPAPAPAPVAAPVSQPIEKPIAQPPAVVEKPVSEPPAPPPVAKKKSPPPKPKADAPKQQPKRDPDDAPSNGKGDIIHLGSDTFKGN